MRTPRRRAAAITAGTTRPRAGIDNGRGRDRDRVDRALHLERTAEADEIRVDRQPQRASATLARLRLQRPRLRAAGRRGRSAATTASRRAGTRSPKRARRCRRCRPAARSGRCESRAPAADRRAAAACTPSASCGTHVDGGALAERVVDHRRRTRRAHRSRRARRAASARRDRRRHAAARPADSGNVIAIATSAVANVPAATRADTPALRVRTRAISARGRRRRDRQPPRRCAATRWPRAADERRRQRPQLPSRRPVFEQRRRAVAAVVDQQAVLRQRQRDARCRR